MDFVNSIGGQLVGNRHQPSSSTAGLNASSLNVAIDSTGSQSDSGPSRANGQAREANNVSTNLLDIFKSTLGEADSYLALYEARVKLEEEYVRGLKVISDKSKEAIVRLDGRIASSMSLGPGGAEMPKARLAWKEIRENHLREMDARMHYIETVRQGVIAPLTVYRDAQERIRKRVKDDLKTSIAAYDEMRHSVLPRAKKTYDKRCEEVEHLRLQQVAIEEQKLLLSQSETMRQSSQGSHSALEDKPMSPASSVTSDGEEGAARSEAEMKATSAQRSSSTRHAHKASKSFSKPSLEAGAGGGAELASTRVSSSTGPSPRSGGEAVLSASPPSGEKKGHFLDALRSRETWETARKEGPKKLNALLSRMRDNTNAGDAGSSLSTSPDSVAAGSQGLGVTLGGGPGSLKSNQNLALKNVKTKREAEEADKAYRKAVFDLETLRMRRHKTMQAARTSVLEARRELYFTCQAVWMQAERSVQMLANSQLGLSLHAEDLLRNSLDSLDDELRRLDQRMPTVEAERVPYQNFYFGECKDLIFGVSLTDYAFSRAQQAPPHLGPPKADAPLLVVKCIDFVEQRALDQPGIYRTSAKHTAIQNLAHALERDEERFSFNAAEDEPSTVAGVLKLYLRQLPDPVLPMPWDERVKYTQERQEQIQTGFASLKGRIRRLPAINQATLRRIIEHLSKVAEHAEQNKMTASNLSIIFGPLLLSQAEHDATSIAAAMEEDRVTEDLILYADTIFDLTRAGAPVLPSLPPRVEPKWNLDQAVTEQRRDDGNSFEYDERSDGRDDDEQAPNVHLASFPSSSTSTQTVIPASPPMAAPTSSEFQHSLHSRVASSSEVPLVTSSAVNIQRSNAVTAGHQRASSRTEADVQSRGTAVPQSAADAYMADAEVQRANSHAARDASGGSGVSSGTSDSRSRAEGGSIYGSSAESYQRTAPNPSFGGAPALAALDTTYKAADPSTTSSPTQQASRNASIRTANTLVTPIDALATPTTAMSSVNASVGHDVRE